MKKLHINVLISIILVLFVFKAPKILDKTLAQEQTNKGLENIKSDWKGNIVVYNGAVEQKWLSSVATKFEKQNRGVFIQIKRTDSPAKDVLDKADIYLGKNINTTENKTTVIFSLIDKKQTENGKIESAKEDFEFDIISQEKQRQQATAKKEQEIQYLNYEMTFSARLEGQKLETSFNFALFVAEEAENMIR